MMASLKCLSRPVALPRASAPRCRYTQICSIEFAPAQRRGFVATTIRFSQRGGSKLFKTADDAVADVKSGSTILSSGFGLCGVAGKLSTNFSGPVHLLRGTTETLIAALQRRGPESLHSLTAVSNNAGVEGKGGLAILTKAGQASRLILSFLGNNKALEKKYLSGELAVELCPQGTLAERIRAGGSGIPAFYTPTAARKCKMTRWNNQS